MHETDPVAGDRGMGETDRPLELGGVVVASLEHLAVRTQKPDRDGIVGRLVTGQTPTAEAERQSYGAVGKGGQRCQRRQGQAGCGDREHAGHRDGTASWVTSRWDGVAPTRTVLTVRCGHPVMIRQGTSSYRPIPALSSGATPVRSLSTLGAMAGRMEAHAQPWRLAPTCHHVGFAPGRVTSVSAGGMSTGVMLSNVGAPGGTRTRRNDQRPARPGTRDWQVRTTSRPARSQSDDPNGSNEDLCGSAHRRADPVRGAREPRRP